MNIRLACGLTLLVCSVAVVPAQQSAKTMRAAGRVMALTANSITVRPGAVTFEFAVDQSTKVIGKGVGTKLKAIKAQNQTPQITDLVDVNDIVSVDYRDMGQGKLHATQVKIRMKGFDKK